MDAIPIKDKNDFTFGISLPRKTYSRKLMDSGIVKRKAIIASTFTCCRAFALANRVQTKQNTTTENLRSSSGRIILIDLVVRNEERQGAMHDVKAHWHIIRKAGA